MVSRHGGRKVRDANGNVIKQYRSFYYVCPSKAMITREPCTSKKIHNADILDAAVWEQAKTFLLNPGPLLQIERSTQCFEAVAPIDALLKEQSDIQVQIQKREKYILNADRERVEKKMTQDRANQLIQIYEQEIAVFQQAEAALKKRIEAQRSLEAERPAIDVHKLARQYRKRIDMLSFEEKREILAILTKRIEISKQGAFQLKLRPFVSQF